MILNYLSGRHLRPVSLWIRLTALYLAFAIPARSQALDESDIQKTVIDFFDALARLDNDGMRKTVTTDFILLEDGEVWTIDSLINAVAPLKSHKFERVNRLKFYSTEQSSDVGWVTYDNQADVVLDGKPRALHWLESAILKKVGGEWKISMLHSTRIVKR